MSDVTKTYTIMRNETKLAMTVKSKSYVSESIAASMPRINDMKERPKKCRKTELNSTYIILQECKQQRLALWQKWKTEKIQKTLRSNETQRSNEKCTGNWKNIGG